MADASVWLEMLVPSRWSYENKALYVSKKEGRDRVTRYDLVVNGG